MNLQKIKARLTLLYPYSWRKRYGEEFAALLEQSLHSPLDIVDVFLGAIDAHMQLFNGEDVSWRTMNMVNKYRTTILIVFAAFIGFVIAGFSLVGLADDSPMIPLMHANLALSISWYTIQAGAVIALLAVVIGGMPLAVTVIRQAIKTKNGKHGLLLVPVVSFLLILVYILLLVLVAAGQLRLPGVVPVVQSGTFPPGNRLLLAGFMLVFILGATFSTWAVWKVVSSTNVGQETYQLGKKKLTMDIYQFAYIPAIITTISMLVMLLATLAWGWIAFSALPATFFGDFGPWRTSTQGWYYGIIVLILLCCAASIYGLVRARKAKASS